MYKKIFDLVKSYPEYQALMNMAKAIRENTLANYFNYEDIETIQASLFEKAKKEYQGIPELQMIEFKPSILHKCHIKQPVEQVLDAEFGSIIMKATQRLAMASAKKVDKKVLRFLYQHYKELGATDIIVLNETEFKEFLLKYLPIYLKEKEEKENAK